MGVKVSLSSEIIGYRVESGTSDNYTFYKDFSEAFDDLVSCQNATMCVTIYFCISGENRTHDIKLATMKDGELTLIK